MNYLKRYTKKGRNSGAQRRQGIIRTKLTNETDDSIRCPGDEVMKGQHQHNVGRSKVCLLPFARVIHVGCHQAAHFSVCLIYNGGQLFTTASIEVRIWQHTVADDKSNDGGVAVGQDGHGQDKAQDEKVNIVEPISQGLGGVVPGTGDQKTFRSIAGPSH